ncbi:flagellar protein FlaG [Lentibacillus sp. CBA3610]|uniref:flagellar protein FlaG n=1 Tax=Lentibacillus sp. CBA3610 TaxID=2518176 RepID=UPI0015958F00|nr:flagellar protein FlaG [Lentibacillus sp. CBA3610]QKY69938.1 flagellar protein FlaG [Lentibacillus sp. CBA3610]
MKLENRLTAVHPLQNEQHSKHMTAAKENRSETSTKNPPYKDETLDADQTETIVSQLNELMEPARTNLKFELHDKLEDYFVKVIDHDTEEVIREIPPEKMLDMYAAMAEFLGLLVDEKI